MVMGDIPNFRSNQTIPEKVFHRFNIIQAKRADGINMNGPSKEGASYLEGIVA